MYSRPERISTQRTVVLCGPPVPSRPIRRPGTDSWFRPGWPCEAGPGWWAAFGPTGQAQARVVARGAASVFTSVLSGHRWPPGPLAVSWKPSATQAVPLTHTSGRCRPSVAVPHVVPVWCRAMVPVALSPALGRTSAESLEGGQRPGQHEPVLHESGGRGAGLRCEALVTAHRSVTVPARGTGSCAQIKYTWLPTSPPV